VPECQVCHSFLLKLLCSNLLLAKYVPALGLSDQEACGKGWEQELFHHQLTEAKKIIEEIEACELLLCTSNAQDSEHEIQQAQAKAKERQQVHDQCLNEW